MEYVMFIDMPIKDIYIDSYQQHHDISSNLLILFRNFDNLH